MIYHLSLSFSSFSYFEKGELMPVLHSLLSFDGAVKMCSTTIQSLLYPCETESFADDLDK